MVVDDRWRDGVLDRVPEPDAGSAVVSTKQKHLDVTFGEDGYMTIWIPISDDDHLEFNVKGKVSPYDILDLHRIVGESLTLRIIDPAGEVVA